MLLILLLIGAFVFGVWIGKTYKPRLKGGSFFYTENGAEHQKKIF